MPHQTVPTNIAVGQTRERPRVMLPLRYLNQGAEIASCCRSTMKAERRGFRFFGVVTQLIYLPVYVRSETHVDDSDT